MQGFITDSRWVPGASGLLLGTDLTQADIQAEYSCVALDIASPTLKLTTDGKHIYNNRVFCGTPNRAIN